MKLLTELFEIQAKIFQFFGYVEDWRVIPLDDGREYYWRLDGEGPGKVCFADSEHELETEEGGYYESDIYTQRFLPKFVYRGEGFTMVAVDTRVDGKKFLQVFDNTKERPIS